jgi:hypothetical protein
VGCGGAVIATCVSGGAAVFVPYDGLRAQAKRIPSATILVNDLSRFFERFMHFGWLLVSAIAIAAVGKNSYPGVSLDCRPRDA